MGAISICQITCLSLSPAPWMWIIPQAAAGEFVLPGNPSWLLMLSASFASKWSHQTASTPLCKALPWVVEKQPCCSLVALLCSTFSGPGSPGLLKKPRLLWYQTQQFHPIPVLLSPNILLSKEWNIDYPSNELTKTCVHLTSDAGLSHMGSYMKYRLLPTDKKQKIYSLQNCVEKSKSK